MEGEGGTIASGALRRVRLGVMLRKSFFRSRVEFSRNSPYLGARYTPRQILPNPRLGRVGKGLILSL